MQAGADSLDHLPEARKLDQVVRAADASSEATWFGTKGVEAMKGRSTEGAADRTNRVMRPPA